MPNHFSLTKNQMYILTVGICLLVALVAGILLLSNNSTPSKPLAHQKPAAKQYTDPQIGLKITPPAGWKQIQPTPTGDIVGFQADKQDSDSSGQSRPTLSAIKTQASGTLAQYADTISQLNARNLKNYHEITPHDLNIDGQPGKVLNYTADVKGHSLRASQLLLIKNGVLYDFNAIALSATWNKHEAEISNAFQSVKLP
jgi:hypothetical protein